MLTIVFVLIAEVVVLFPSIAKYRNDWFHERIEAAYLVGLALDGSTEEMIEEEIAMQLFETAGILGVTVARDEQSRLILAPDINPHGPSRLHRVDLDNQSPFEMLFNPWAALISQGDRYIRVMGAPRHMPKGKADLIVSQRELRRDLWAYARNIFGLSLVISTLTASLVYWALNRIIVKPVKKLTENMAAFEANPDRADRILKPSDRSDEVGDAERRLAAMQASIHDLLNERRRLAALGAGISKISHDLRNILASAQLMSDRLAKSDDPQVKKLSPRLVAALDRAVVMSRDTLAYGRMSPGVLKKTNIDLRALVDEVFDAAAVLGVRFINQCPEGFVIVADRTHFYRSIVNLVRNAADAMAPQTPAAIEHGQPEPNYGTVTIAVETDKPETQACTISIADTGPGVPTHAQDALFEPFKGSQKPGGSGLGLAIASEIIRAHGGELTLAETSGEGAVFQIVLPAPAGASASTMSAPAAA
ncbi:MAG: HAMP domain-containing sensor histidine kinase [Pseudomonadota bacterium]